MLGAVTLAALAISASLLWSIICLLGEFAGLTLTLSGIVGIIVSIGVSLDSSVVYFENLKEDVRNGKTLRTRLDGSQPSSEYLLDRWQTKTRIS
jgi:preprotein translocase subunit SecD